MPQQHELPATPETVVWGYLDAALPPVLEVDSGDTVTVHCLPAGGPESFPPDASLVGEDYRRVVETVPKGCGGHILTGPVAVRGAEPGDVLQVDILEARLRQRWGYVSIMPLCGTLPDEFTDYETIHPTLDPERGVGLLPWGTELPLDPFFGVVATAPPPAWGRVTSNVPRAFGGNMDNKEPDPGPPSTCRCSTTGPCSWSGTATPCRATARSASPRSRPASPARSGSPSARTWTGPSRSPRRRPT